MKRMFAFLFSVGLVIGISSVSFAGADFITINLIGPFAQTDDATITVYAPDGQIITTGVFDRDGTMTFSIDSEDFPMYRFEIKTTKGLISSPFYRTGPMVFYIDVFADGSGRIRADVEDVAPNRDLIPREGPDRNNLMESDVIESAFQDVQLVE